MNKRTYLNLLFIINLMSCLVGVFGIFVFALMKSNSVINRYSIIISLVSMILILSSLFIFCLIGLNEYENRGVKNEQI